MPEMQPCGRCTNGESLDDKNVHQTLPLIPRFVIYKSTSDGKVVIYVWAKNILETVEIIS